MSAQAGSASLAAATAASSSAAVESGRTAACSPVAGLNTGAVRGLVERASSPPMMFEMVCIAGFLSDVCRNDRSAGAIGTSFRLFKRLEDAAERVEQLVDLRLLR